MANLIHTPIDFHRGPVTPNLGFGFGMASPAIKGGWQQPAAIGHNNSAEDEGDFAQARQGSASHLATSSTGLRDDAMDRSPTPERPKRGPPKRARVTNTSEVGDKEKGKENKPPAGGDEVDVGVLLASLPPQSLLPLLTSLLNAQPSLKSTVLPLIPRPTLETAVQMLAQSAKKLRDAYPYSNAHTMPASSPSPSSSSTSFGFGSGYGSARPSTSMFGNSTASFGRSTQTSMFGQQQSQANSSGMRDSYILSRLGPHISEFVSTCTSYLPYFSYIPSSSPSSSSQPQPLPKEKLPPTEIHQLLSALTYHILAQPPLTQSSLIPLLVPRLQKEWLAWVDRVDAIVNSEGGMFRDETVKGWEKGLDEFAEVNKDIADWQCMKEVRDRWVARVGWLVGRRAAINGMDMEEEL